MLGRARDTHHETLNKYVVTAYWKPIFNVRRSQEKMTLWPIQNCSLVESEMRIVQALQIPENNLYFSLAIRAVGKPRVVHHGVTGGLVRRGPAAAAREVEAVRRAPLPRRRHVGRRRAAPFVGAGALLARRARPADLGGARAEALEEVSA